MKLETGIVIAKGVCLTSSTTLLALAGSLSQWSNEPGNPTALQWAMIAGTSLGAGLGSLGAFLSSSFGNYVKSRNGVNINSPQLTKP